jgi:hypothetical protein
MGFGKGQRLARFTPIAGSTGTVVTFHHTRVKLLVAQQGEHMRKTRFAMERPHLDLFNPTAFVVFLALAIGQALPPTYHRTTALALRRVTPTEHLQKRRCIAGIGISENGWQMPSTKAVFRALD